MAIGGISFGEEGRISIPGYLVLSDGPWGATGHGRQEYHHMMGEDRKKRQGLAWYGIRGP